MIEIYTDGSCSPNPGIGGWSFAAFCDGQEIHAASGGEVDTTNNRMELMGVFKALQWANKSRAASVTIISDSTYALNGVKKWTDKGAVKAGAKNADLWKLIVPAQQQCGATLQWIRGHSGNPGNMRADNLASRAASRTRKLKAPTEIDQAAIQPKQQPNQNWAFGAFYGVHSRNQELARLITMRHRANKATGACRGHSNPQTGSALSVGSQANK